MTPEREGGISIVGMPVVEVPTDEITYWDTFHDVFAAVLGFPEFYRRNMNAWIDCLTYADEDDGMRSVVGSARRRVDPPTH
jgi:hypothetical protein